MSNVIQFPCVDGAYASGRSMPGLTTPELRIRARDNYYTALRHQQVDPLTANDLADGYLDNLDRLAKIMSEG
jgi:hypothetical protein